MGVPGFGESQARICNEDAEELLCSLQGSAFSLVSSQRSHAVHADQFSHNKYPLLLTHRTTQIHLLLLCPTQCLSVKNDDLARLTHRDHAQEGKCMASSFLRGRMAFLAVAQALTAVNKSCNRGTQDRSAWRPCRTREPRSFSFEKSRLSLLSSARGDPQESPGGRLSGGRAVRATGDVQPGEAQHSW